MYQGNTAPTAAGWPRNHKTVMSQNNMFNTAMIGVPARTRLNRTKLRKPNVRNSFTGWRMWTSQVCR